MRVALVALAVGALISARAEAHILGVQVRGGDVYVQFPKALRRLTHDGFVSDAIVSPDHKLLAYLHDGKDAGASDPALNDICLCSVPQRTCVLLIRGFEGNTTDNNLADIMNLRFSPQAGERPDGILGGSIYFLSEAGGANTGALRRVLLGGKTTVRPIRRRSQDRGPALHPARGLAVR